MKIDQNRKIRLHKEIEDNLYLDRDLDSIISALTKIKEIGVKNGFDKFKIQEKANCPNEGLYHCVIASRPETDEEYLSRVEQEKEQKKEQEKEAESQQYKTYLKLKEKFEN